MAFQYVMCFLQHLQVCMQVIMILLILSHSTQTLSLIQLVFLLCFSILPI